jgi:hypothetical protein
MPGLGVEWTPVFIKELVAIHKHYGIESIDYSRNVTEDSQEQADEELNL